MDFLLAAGASPYFVEAATLIVCGALIAYLGYRLGLVPIVGFLLTGVVIGPNALGLVTNQELIDATADIGVILLLFTIGIEFSLAKLAQIQRLIFGGGGLQVLLASASTTGLLLLFGVSWQAGLFTGFLVALSSTAIVLKLLADRSETNTEPGQVSLGLLIFQDLAIIVMVMLVPMLAGEGGTPGEIGLALVKAAAMIVVTLLVARRLMPIVLERVAKTCSQELFLLSLIGICFGTAYLASLAGVSVALGAFLAGLVVSESRFSEHAFSEIMPLQILFAATFFVSVGMLLDLSFLVQNLPLVLGVVGVVLVLKIVTTGASALALGYRAPVALAAGLWLAQVGEFSFVLVRSGAEVGLFPAGLEVAGSQTFIAATVVLMVLTPPLSQLGMRWARRLDDERAAASAPAEAGPAEPTPMADEHAGLSDHVIVAGYGRTARRLARALQDLGVPVAVITLSPPRADEAEAAGLPVVRGDAGRPAALQHAHLERARLLVLPENDPEAAHRIAAVARTLRPHLPILARARYQAGADELHEVGVAHVVTEEFESVIGLVGQVLDLYERRGDDLLRRTHAMRADDYRALRPLAAAPAAPGPSRDAAAASDARPRPRLYGTDWCPLTGGFRAYFKRHQIPFDYFNVEEDPAAEEAVREMNGGKVKFPMVAVGDVALKNPPIDELEQTLEAHGWLAGEAAPSA